MGSAAGVCRLTTSMQATPVHYATRGLSYRHYDQPWKYDMWSNDVLSEAFHMYRSLEAPEWVLFVARMSIASVILCTVKPA